VSKGTRKQGLAELRFVLSDVPKAGPFGFAQVVLWAPAGSNR